MKINSILKYTLCRAAFAVALTFGSGCFLPSLHAEDNVVTYEYTADNWAETEPGKLTHTQEKGKVNNVSISNVNSPGTNVWGAISSDETSGADGNTVTVKDSVLHDVNGGNHESLRFDEAEWAVVTGSGNVVEIKNSTIEGNVHGAYTVSGNACNNEVTLEDTEVKGDVCGGSAGYRGTSQDNRVIIRCINKKIDLSNTTVSAGLGKNGANNVLTLEGYQGQIKDIRGVTAINLTLTDWNPGEYAVTVTGDRTNLDGVAVTVNLNSIAVGAEVPQVGDELKLISGARGTDGMILTMGKTTGVKQGVSKIYDFEISVTGSTATVQGAEDVNATVERVRLNPQTKALAEARVAAMALHYRSGDLVAEQGVFHAQHAAATKGEGKGLAAFFAMASGHHNIDSGSHVDVDGLAAMLGAAAAPLEGRAFTLCGFVESGWGQYSTYNSFVDAATVRAEGESSYCGGGLLASYAFNTPRTRGLELNASLRAGRQESDFGSSDLRDGFGNCASYDVDSSYLAGHVGVSYTRDLRSRLSATVYARYLWSRLGSADANVCGDAVHFDAFDSNRLRFGARAAWQRSERWQLYTGLAFEWECSGTARAMTQGMGIEAPSMRGGSGLGEVGAVWQPDTQRPLWVDGALQGSVGKNKGFGAKLGCGVAF